MSASTMAYETRPLVNIPLIRAHFLTSTIFFAIVLLGGFAYGLQLTNAYPFPDLEWASPGRVRMLHTNAAAYGFIANAFIAGMLWAIPRLTQQPVLSDRLGWLIFWAWQIIVSAALLGIIGGYAQAIEWGETPIFSDPLIVVGLVLVVINLSAPILRTREQGLYVSLWYFLAAFAWTGLVYIMGNYIPQFFVPGAAGAAIAGLYIHDLVGLFVTPVGWGLMYYFVPINLEKPIWSHALSLVGFWGIAFFYPMQGVHHFLWSPIPMYAQYGAVVATIAIEVVVTTVLVNFFGTLYGRANAVRSNMQIRWYYVGMINYLITCFQCSIQVTLTVQKVIHFTDWVVGHAHLVMFGVFGFWIMGMYVELWPRLVEQRAWHSRRLLTGHFWFTLIGLELMFITLTAAGLIQGYSWLNLDHWSISVLSSIPFWWVRSVAGLLIIVGTSLLFVNMWLTARQRVEEHAPTGSPATAQTI